MGLEMCKAWVSGDREEPREPLVDPRCHCAYRGEPAVGDATPSFAQPFGPQSGLFVREACDDRLESAARELLGVLGRAPQPERVGAVPLGNIVAEAYVGSRGRAPVCQKIDSKDILQRARHGGGEGDVPTLILIRLVRVCFFHSGRVKLLSLPFVGLFLDYYILATYVAGRGKRAMVSASGSQL